MGVKNIIEVCVTKVTIVGMQPYLSLLSALVLFMQSSTEEKQWGRSGTKFCNALAK